MLCKYYTAQSSIYVVCSLTVTGKHGYTNIGCEIKMVYTVVFLDFWL